MRTTDPIAATAANGGFPYPEIGPNLARVVGNADCQSRLSAARLNTHEKGTCHD